MWAHSCDRVKHPHHGKWRMPFWPAVPPCGLGECPGVAYIIQQCRHCCSLLTLSRLLMTVGVCLLSNVSMHRGSAVRVLILVYSIRGLHCLYYDMRFCHSSVTQYMSLVFRFITIDNKHWHPLQKQELNLHTYKFIFPHPSQPTMCWLRTGLWKHIVRSLAKMRLRCQLNCTGASAW